MTELKSVFDFRKEEKVLIEIPFQFIYSNNFELSIQFEQTHIFTETNKTLFLQAGVDPRRKDNLFHANGAQGSAKQDVSDPVIARDYQSFETSTKEI